MAGPKGAELGTKTPFKLRAGIDIPHFRGVNKDRDPGALRPDELQDGINITLTGGRIDCRGGLSKVNSGAALSGCIKGLFDSGGGGGDGTAVRLYISNPSTTTVALYDSELSTALQTFVFSSITNGGMRRVFHVFNGEMYISGRDGLYKMPVLDASGTISGAPVNVAAVNNVAGSVELFGKLWMSTTDNQTIYSWDGKTLTEDVTSIGTYAGDPLGGIVLAAFNEDVLAFGRGWAKRRDGGSWTSLTIPSGYSDFQARSAEIFNNTLYVGVQKDYGDTNGGILSWDGSSLAQARLLTHSGGDPSYDGCVALKVFNGFLYYLHREINFGAIYLGRYDGSSWTDNHQTFGNPYLLNTHVLEAYRGSLFSAGDESGKNLIKSAGTSTSSSWSTVSTDPLGTAERILDIRTL